MREKDEEKWFPIEIILANKRKPIEPIKYSTHFWNNHSKCPTWFVTSARVRL